MKFRHEKIGITDAEERELERAVRAMSGAEQEPPTAPPEAYWQNQIIRSNQRIDHATSGKALSINWAFRVAIPGVVAVLSFVIGLHYYVPEKPRQTESVSEVLLSLPTQAVDSLLAGNAAIDASVSVADVGADIFRFSQAQIADYLITRGAAETLMEGLSDQQVGDLVSALGSVQD
jgi:hypothetical protein